MYNRIINKDNTKSFELFFCILIILSIFMIYSFSIDRGIDTGHDIIFHKRRFAVLMNALKNGSFPVYLDYTDYTGYGYGYGTKLFYPDFILIPFAILANYTNCDFALKIMWFVITIICGLFTYRFMNKTYKNTLASAYVALIYTFSSYRLQDIYERAAFGEAIAFSFIPIVFLGLYEIIKGDYKKWYIISIGFTLLILSHLISSVLVFLAVIIFIIIYNKNLRQTPIRIFYLIIAGMVTIFLSAYFLFPFIEQSIHIDFNIRHMDYLGYRDHHETFQRFLRSLLLPHPVTKIYDYIPYLGTLVTFCIILRFFVKEKSNYKKSIDIFIITGLIFLILTIDIFNWNNLYENYKFHAIFI